MQIVVDPDAVLSTAAVVVATADSVILDRCNGWLNLARHVINVRVPQAWVIDLRD